MVAPTGVSSEGLSARYGNVTKHKVSAAVKAVMAFGDSEVLGPLAQLGTVNDYDLSALLSAHLGTTLRTLVVRTRECR